MEKAFLLQIGYIKRKLYKIAPKKNKNIIFED